METNCEFYFSDYAPDDLDLTEPFLALEPPLSPNDYSFSLENEEGLHDLFDFSFDS